LSTAKNCHLIQIPHCVEADDTGATCTTCAVGYFKDGNACSLQYIPFCQEYTVGLNQCTNCYKGYQLVGNNSCTKVEIANCKTYTQNANTCDVCESEFEPNASKSECKKKDVIGCTGYSDGDCNAYNTAYFWSDSGTIKPKTEPYCQTPDSAGGGCTTCVDGYEKHNNGTINICRKPTSTGCAAFNALGQCIACQQGYWGTSTAPITCTAFSNIAGCLEFSRTEDKCTVCEPGKFWTTTTTGSPPVTTNVCGAITAGHLKTLNCFGFEGTASASGAVCNKCPYGSFSLSLGSDVFVKMTDTGVLSYNADGTIKQLKEGFIVDSNTKVQYSTANTPCLQLKAFTGALAARDLTTAAQCAKCRNQRTHYLSGGNCSQRSNLLCHKFDENNDNCISCKEGYANSGTSPNFCTSTTPNGVTNCKYTNGSGVGCYECNSDYLVSSTDSNNCHSNSGNLKHCRVFDHNTTNACTTCEDGAYLNKDDNTCLKPVTCTLGVGTGALGTYCQFCLPGFKPDTASKYKCIPAFADDVCALYKNLDVTAHESICVKCKDSTKIPYNNKNGSNYDFRCVPNKYGEMSHSYILQDGATIEYKTIDLPNPEYTVITTVEVEGITSPTKICQPLNVENCMTYDFTASKIAPCTKCMDGYYLLTGKNGQQCYKGGLGGCLQYTTYDNCAICQNHWIRKEADSKGYCEQIDPIPDCEVHSPTEVKCLRCAPGYLLRKDECHLQDYTNCKYYDFELGICFGCDTGYYLDDGICQPYTNTNCLELSRTSNACNKCAKNYYLKDGDCLVNSTRNCAVKSSLFNNCIVCNDGFYLELASGVCKPNISTNCLVYDHESPNCLSCSDGYFLFNGVCAVYSVQNCTIMDSEQDKCLLCHDGYFLNGWGSCEKYSIKNCNIKDPNENLCLECNKGYFNDPTGLCTRYTVKNCNIYNNYKDQCFSCIPGFYKNPQNDCVKYTKIDNCETVDASQDACMSCKPGYYNDFGICRKYSVTNCALYKADADVCTTCLDGYFLLIYTCVAYTVRCEQYELTSNQCVTCREGYYLDDGICYVNNGLFCKEMSPFRNGCESCVDGFYLDKGQCKIREHSNNCKEVYSTADLCKSCYDTHYIAAGKCISYAIDTCKTFNLKKDLCVECETGKYWMSHNVCEEYTVDHCQTFDPNADKCTLCEKGKWYLNNGICVESSEVEHCMIYSNTTNACEECDEDYYLASPSECRRNPSGMFKCIQYTDENTCVKCELGFYLDRNYCQKSMVTVENCVNYSAEGTCESCDSNFLLLENVCVEKVETSCATWVDAENCLTCPSNQVIKTNEDSKKICEDSGLTGCVEAKAGSSSNTCEKCQDKKILKDGACADPDSPLVGCKVYIKEGECSECDDGYTLTKSKNGCVSNYTLMSSNCAFGMEKSSPVCHSCMSGYQLDVNRECVQCGGEGCSVCDPYDSTKCIFCKAGYDHDGSSCAKDSASSNKVSPEVFNDIRDHFKSGFKLQGLVMIFANIFLMILVV